MLKRLQSLLSPLVSLITTHPILSHAIVSYQLDSLRDFPHSFLLSSYAIAPYAYHILPQPLLSTFITRTDGITDAPAAPVAPAKVVLGPIPTDFTLKSDYYIDCQQVLLRIILEETYFLEPQSQFSRISHFRPCLTRLSLDIF